MAQSRRTSAADPAAIYAAHAAEARAEMAAATTDAARAHFDHAAACHDTAARLLARVPRLQRTLATIRVAATGVRNRAQRVTVRGRPGQTTIGEFYDGEVAKVERAIAACPAHANKHYLVGLERSAAGREHERRVGDPVLVAAEMVRATEGDAEFRTAAEHRAARASEEPAEPPPLPAKGSRRVASDTPEQAPE